MELLGTIKSIGDLETIKQLKKKTVLVETQSKFPQTIPVEFLNDKIDLVNDLKVGQTINLGINLRSNESSKCCCRNNIKLTNARRKR